MMLLEHSLRATLSQNCSPTAFHSRSFTVTEKRYFVIEEEAAAIIGCSKKMELLSPRLSVFPCE